MSQAISRITTIPRASYIENPLDAAVRKAAAGLLCHNMTRLGNREPTKGDAQALGRDLLDLAKIVDDMLLAIGREARDHFGHGVAIDLFTDQLRSKIEGDAVFILAKAVEDREEARAEAIADLRRDYWRNMPVTDDRWHDFPAIESPSIDPAE